MQMFTTCLFIVYRSNSFQSGNHCGPAQTSGTQKSELNLPRVGGSSAGCYLRELSCGCGRWERVGHHGAEYIQVVVLACASAIVVGRCGGWCVWDRNKHKLVLQVKYSQVVSERSSET